MYPLIAFDMHAVVGDLIQDRILPLPTIVLLAFYPFGGLWWKHQI